MGPAASWQYSSVVVVSATSMAYILLNSIATGYKSHYRPDRGFYSSKLYSLKVHTSKALRSLIGILFPSTLRVSRV